MIKYISKCIHMENENYLGKILNIKIDRQLGSRHPNDAIDALIEFQEQYFKHTIIRKEKTLTR